MCKYKQVVFVRLKLGSYCGAKNEVNIIQQGGKKNDR